ncbi:hypothetical protein X975_13745, partial [Stegodyphus mimosarum]
MTRERFHMLWKAWHFNNNEDLTDESERLSKVRPLLNCFVSKFINVYKPIQQLSLDEGIIPRRGEVILQSLQCNEDCKIWNSSSYTVPK